MTAAPLVLIEPTAEAAGAGRLLARHRIGALPVVDAGRLVGMLTKTDFLSQLPNIEIPEQAVQAASAPAGEVP